MAGTATSVLQWGGSGCRLKEVANGFTKVVSRTTVAKCQAIVLAGDDNGRGSEYATLTTGRVPAQSC